MKPLKYASDDELYTKLHEGLLLSDAGDEADKESHSESEFTSQSSGEDNITLSNNVRPQSEFFQARS